MDLFPFLLKRNKLRFFFPKGTSFFCSKTSENKVKVFVAFPVLVLSLSSSFPRTCPYTVLVLSLSSSFPCPRSFPFLVLFLSSSFPCPRPYLVLVLPCPCPFCWKNICLMVILKLTNNWSDPGSGSGKSESGSVTSKKDWPCDASKITWNLGRAPNEVCTVWVYTD